jgi:hypothetical protein
VPCPLFEPRGRVSEPRTPSPRLPLIYEFDGICHAGQPMATADQRFQYCNRGNAKGNCANFPNSLAITAIRFTVTARSANRMTVMMVEEHNHWPGAWRTIDFMLEEKRLDPEISDVCQRAQILCFCNAYLGRENER